MAGQHAAHRIRRPLFVVSACQYQPPPVASAAIDWPRDRPLIRGGSVIVSPLGEVLAGPVYNREELLVATIDLDDVVRGRYDLDVIGHYARPDVFALTVDEADALMTTLRTALFAFAALLAAIATCAQAGEDVCNVSRRKVNLNFAVKDVAGEDVRLSQYKGQVILLNFWATWCGPCKREIPSLIALYRDYKDRGFVVLGVSVDSEVWRVKPYARASKINYPVLIGAGHEEFSDAFGLFIGYPTSVMIARDGRVCVRHVGLASRSLLEQQVDALL